MVKKLLVERDVVVGIDQSAVGSAMVALVDGKLAEVKFYADTKAAAKAKAALGAEMPREVKAGDERGRTERLAALYALIIEFVDRIKPTHAALEDYALARLAYSHHLGEVGGIVRLALYDQRVFFRTYDVQAVKLFATGNGAAEKAEMVLACRDKWEGRNFLEYGKSDGAGGNVADAYVIAQLLRMELALRRGSVRMDQLTEAERRVFLRTTKQRPTNLLTTEFAGGIDG